MQMGEGSRDSSVGGDWLDCNYKILLQKLQCKCIGCSWTFTKEYFSTEIFVVVMITLTVNYWMYFCKIKYDWIKCVVAVKKTFLLLKVTNYKIYPKKKNYTEKQLK